MGWITSGYPFVMLAAEPSGAGIGEMSPFHVLVLSMLFALLMLGVCFVILWGRECRRRRGEHAARENHLGVVARQQQQMLELLDMINDNANLNTDYLLAALKAEVKSSRPAGSAISEPIPPPVTPAPLSSIDTGSAEAAEPAAGSAGVDLAEARRLLDTREADHPAHLQKCREMLLPELEGARRAEAATLLSEALFWLGEYSSSKKEKENYHQEGVEYGGISVALDGGRVAPNLWYAANMGSHGLARGIMSSLFYIKDIEKAGSRALALDEAFFYGAPLRLMGRFYHQCPPWPVGKGDLKKAVSLLEKAVATGPDFLLNHLYLAEVYLAKRNKVRARELLTEILQAEPRVFPVYQGQIQTQARELMKKF